MGHDHNHARDVHAHAEPEADAPLYMKVAHAGLFYVSLAGVFTYFANSHGNLADALHGVTDVGTIYVMAYLAARYIAGALSKSQVNRYAGILNTGFLFLSAGGILLDLYLRETKGLNPFVTLTASSIMLVGNLYQFKLLHGAHGHDHGQGSHAFLSTLQHVFYDAVFSLSVALMSLVAIMFGKNVERLDWWVAFLLSMLLLASGCRNISKMRKGEKIELI